MTACHLSCSSENQHSRRPPRATAAILSAVARCAPRTSTYKPMNFRITICSDSPGGDPDTTTCEQTVKHQLEKKKKT
jgi:hypothetical protein